MSLEPLSHPRLDEQETDSLRVAILRIEIARGALTLPEIAEDLADTSYGVLLTEGFPVGEIAVVLGSTKLSLDGTREVLRGAPAEWVEAFEEGDSP